jgi:hypothetical protein
MHTKDLTPVSVPKTPCQRTQNTERPYLKCRGRNFEVIGNTPGAAYPKCRGQKDQDIHRLFDFHSRRYRFIGILE